MCQSQAEGGKRCASHTRPKFEAATFGTPEWDEAATEYARTKQGNARLTAMVLGSVAERDWERAAAAEKALSQAAQAEAAQREWNQRRQAVITAAFRATDESKIRRAASSADPGVRAAVAANYAAPDDVLVALATDSDSGVRATVAERVSAPDAAFATLMRDPEERVQRALRSWLNRPRFVFEHWAASESPGDRDFAVDAADSQNHPDVLDRLASDPDWHVRRRVANSRNAPPSALGRLASDPDVRVAESAMANEALPMADLETAVRARGRELVERGIAAAREHQAVERRLSREGRYDLLPLVR